MNPKTHLILQSIFLVAVAGVSRADIDRSKSLTDAQIDAFYGAGTPEHGAAAQRESLRQWQIKIESAKSTPPQEAIPVLSSAVKSLARYPVFQLEERIRVYDQARDALLAIPGHATYWANQLKSEQMKVQNLPLKPVPGRIEYDRNRQEILRGLLSHLPSPESVQALGSFLWDDKDAHQRGADDDWAPVQGNSFYAAEGLRNLGLRNSPQPMNPLQSTPDVVLWRSWYEDVKNGKRAFSFEGQNVEYRFGPDGTVSTSPIKAEDRPAPAPSRTSAAAVPQEPAQKNFSWIWLTAAVSAVTALLVIAGVRKWRG